MLTDNFVTIKQGVLFYEKSASLDVIDFMPYLLDQAAEASSIGFQKYYKAKHGMLRTEWRVVFHLGRHGEMTAKECKILSHCLRKIAKL